MDELLGIQNRYLNNFQKIDMFEIHIEIFKKVLQYFLNTFINFFSFRLIRTYTICSTIKFKSYYQLRIRVFRLKRIGKDRITFVVFFPFHLNWIKNKIKASNGQVTRLQICPGHLEIFHFSADPLHPCSKLWTTYIKFMYKNCIEYL